MRTDNYIILKRYETPLNEKWAKILSLSNGNITEVKWETIKQTLMNRGTANCVIKILDVKKTANNRVIELSKKEVQSKIDVVLNKFPLDKVEDMVCKTYEFNRRNRDDLITFRECMRVFIWVLALLKEAWHGENPGLDDLVGIIETIRENSDGSYEKYTYHKYD